ncbi:hypothetical protein ABMA27_005898 [Loxostege sticticalis]|uniref:CCHC-type domain-containing protein n=1 Tax=Loxostege sticticalis TaxID=481309 RepID=A0ABR3HGX6_LOXSC
MDEPEDPGGGIPLAAHFVTISDENPPALDTEGSHVETDASETNVNGTKRKRASYTKICKHCNKKRRKHHKLANSVVNVDDCQCRNELIRDRSPAKRKDSNVNIRLECLPKNSTPAPEPTQKSPDSQPNPSRGRMLYQASDVSPYIVHVQREPATPNENCYVHPVTFGFFLKKNKFNNIVDGSLKKIGRNRLAISFSNFSSANEFINSDTLKSNFYKAFVPVFSVTRMGVVRGVPCEWTDEDIINNITVPIGCGNIIKVRRLKKKSVVNGKSEFTPIETVVLTFDGQILPKRVFLCYNSLPVDLYIYPTVQCFNCCRYGHIKTQCRSTPKCYKCGQGHSGESCLAEEEEVSCCLCTGSHYANSKKCPEFNRQKSIKETMAKNCISYSEALKLHPPISKSYADVLTSLPSQLNSQQSSSRLSPPVRKPPSSYKKTILLKPSSPRKHEKGYDRSAHDALIKDYDIPLPQNGTALNNNSLSDNPLADLSVKELILTLINTLTQFNSNNFSPSIVAQIEDSLVSNLDSVKND